MKDVFRVRRMWRPRAELKDRYDVVIIGGGSHGLATAYYLAKNHGITNVAILEKSYIGSGAAGPQHDDHPRELPHARGRRVLRGERQALRGPRRRARLQPPLLAAGPPDARPLRPRDHHRERAGRGQPAARDRQPRHLPGRDRASSARRWISPRTSPGRSRRRSTTRRAGSSATTPSSGASRAAPTARGVEIHPYTEVTGHRALERPRHRRRDQPRRRSPATPSSARTAGWSTLVADLAGVPLPITTHILQAFVTEPLKPFLDVIIVSSQMHVYISQTDRGEFLIGAEIEPYTTYKGIGTFPFLEYSARHALELFPQLEQREDPAPVDRALRPLARLQPDPRRDRGRGLPRLLRLGHVRLQGRADRRDDARRADRDGADAAADRAVRARALLHRHPRLRAGRRGRLATEQRSRRGHADAFQPRDRAGGDASPDRRDRRGARASSRTSTTSTAATRPRSTSPSSNACATSPTASSSASRRSRRRRRARARRRPRSR